MEMKEFKDSHPTEATGHPHEGTGACCGHHAAAVDRQTGKQLLLTLAPNLLTPVAQIIGGFMANSNESDPLRERGAAAVAWDGKG
jgi:hypothetical protein